MSARARDLATRALAGLEARLGSRSLAEALPTLEELFTSPEYFGVDTATDLQRAICRIAEGRPLDGLETAQHLSEALSSWTDTSRTWPGRHVRRPQELVFLAATRSGKTRLACAQAILMALQCDVSALKVGEVPRVPIVSVSLDLAQAAYGQLVGALTTQPKLRQYLVGEPTAGTVLLRHPSGRTVEITVSAGRRAGSSLVARWLAGAVFDEAPRMSGSDDGSIINLDDSLAAIRSRMLPGAQVLLLGSPWAPSGPVYTKVLEAHGKPSARIVVIRAKGPWLNPAHWTPERQEALRTSVYSADQLSYRTDCEAEWADPEAGLLSAAEIDACTRKGQLVRPPVDGYVYAAAIDPAVRLNAWTIIVKHREGNVDVVDVARQWHRKGGEGPLDADKVLAEIAGLLGPYRVKHIATDKWQVDSLSALARHHGLNLIEYDYDAQQLTEVYLGMQTRINQKFVELPADVDLRADLLGCRRRITTSGMSIELPTSGNGRHCDYVPALARALMQRTPDATPAPRPLASQADREARLVEAAKRRYTKKKSPHWWAEAPWK